MSHINKPSIQPSHFLATDKSISKVHIIDKSLGRKNRASQSWSNMFGGNINIWSIWVLGIIFCLEYVSFYNTGEQKSLTAHPTCAGQSLGSLTPSKHELPVSRRRVWEGAPSLWPLPPSSGVSTAATLSAAAGEIQTGQLSYSRVLSFSLPSNPQPHS